jgi:PAS domain S-box-containing protein
MTAGEAHEASSLAAIGQIADARMQQLLIDAIPDYGIYLLDPAGFILKWNVQAKRQSGYGKEILGRHVSVLFTEEDRRRNQPRELLNIARDDGRFEGEGWGIRKDGSRFWGSTVIECLRAADGTVLGYANMVRDQTERREARWAQKEAERQLHLLINGVFDYAIYMLDPSGIVTNWNTGAERIKGYRAEEIVGQHFSRFYSREDRAAGLPARALETAAREGRHESEGWQLRKEGGRFWASVMLDAIRSDEGELIGFANITRDITERRAAQEAISESERQFRLLVGGVTDYAIYMLDPNGIVSSWNAGAAHIKGYSADEVLGQHFSKFFTEADRLAGAPAKALHTAIAKGKYESEGWRVRKDGSLFWASAIIEALRDERGELAGFAKITRDISERRDAQLALQQAQSQLAHSQKMDALGKLTAGVAHDFNNLLMVVSGNAQILKRMAGDNPKMVRAITSVETAANRGAVLTRQLLAFSRQQRLNPARIDLKERIAGMLELLSSSTGGTVTFVTQLPPSLWPVEVDVTELELALVNLAVNARDAMPEGGVIALAAENVDMTRGDVGIDLDGAFVALTLADTGIGIPEDILPKIFDPFFTTKEVDKGTGLGLAQVHGFVHQSGGAVTVSSEIGHGTRFTMYLPRAQAEARPPAQESEATIADGEGLILLVEDNPEVADVTATMLEQLGYRVRIARNAAVGLELVEAGESFDLVLSDIVMAGEMDGVGLARTLKERRPDLPVLLATGYSASAATIGQEFPILRKPYQMNELAQALFRLLAAKRPASDAPNLVRLEDVRRRQAPPG